MDVAAGYLVYNVMQVSIPKVGEAQGTEITAYIHLPLFSPMIKSYLATIHGRLPAEWLLPLHLGVRLLGLFRVQLIVNAMWQIKKFT